jgi:hypothetical protein
MGTTAAGRSSINGGPASGVAKASDSLLAVVGCVKAAGRVFKPLDQPLPEAWSGVRTHRGFPSRQSLSLSPARSQSAPAPAHATTQQQPREDEKGGRTCFSPPTTSFTPSVLLLLAFHLLIPSILLTLVCLGPLPAFEIFPTVAQNTFFVCCLLPTR